MPGVTKLPAGRRIVVALVAVMIAALLFRPQIASALVSRGDEFLARGNAGAARVYYRRAMLVDGESPTAVDRFVFFGTMSRERAVLQQAIAAASAYLSAHAADAVLLEDRALCYQRTGRFEEAASDFEAAARVTGSGRDFTFAGWAAFRSGHSARARRLWLEALRRSPAYGPAMSALRKLSK